MVFHRRGISTAPYESLALVLMQIPFPWNEAIKQPIQLEMFTIVKNPMLARRQKPFTASKLNVKNDPTDQKQIIFGTVIILLISTPEPFIFVL